MHNAWYIIHGTKYIIQDKIKEKAEAVYAEKVNFSSETELYSNTITNCIQSLVNSLDGLCEPALNAMLKVLCLSPSLSLFLLSLSLSFYLSVSVYLSVSLPPLSISCFLSSSIRLFSQTISLSLCLQVNWATLDTVGDQSAYTTAITSHVTNTCPVVRDLLQNSRKYFTNYCLKFVNTFIPRY